MALALGVIVMQFSYFPYAAAFIPPEGETEPVIDTGLLGIGFAIAPFVFVVVGFVSKNPLAPKRVLISMGLLLAIGLALGLVSPVLGAAAGFGVGIALTLNIPSVEGQTRRRLVAVGLAIAYMLLMLIVFPPAGVLAGAILPALAVGFADEYGAWRYTRGQAA